MKMSKALAAVLALTIGASVIVGCGGGEKKKEAAPAKAGKKIVIYTSMKESLISGIVAGFKKANPGVEVDYQSAGAGKLMAKIAAERQSGKILADVIWTSEVPDFYKMKSEGILENYKSPVFKELLNPLPDYDGSFTAARLGTLGVAVNTDKVKAPLTSWDDLKKPEYKNGFGVANPALSGTAYMSVALLEKQFGWDYFKALKANGTRLGKGSGQVVDDTASGELKACLAVDYITNNKIKKGAHLKMYYPKEMLVVPSPVAIFKGGQNIELSKKFVDYLLGKEAQAVVAKEGTLPVRTDVEIPAKFGLPAPKEAMERGIKVSYTEILPKKEATIKTFSEIIGKK